MSLPNRQRPSDRVREYILSLRDLPDTPGRLPTMRDLAAHLGVSLATVQSVYRELKNAGAITTRTGDGSFFTPVGGAKSAAPTRRKVFFNHVPGEEAGPVLVEYYGPVIQNAIQRNLRLDFAGLDADRPAAVQVRELWEAGELHGLIIFPFTPCEELVAVCDELGVPYISIHPPNPQTYVNFVTPDFYGAGYRIGEAWARAGRRSVAFFAFGSIMPSSTAWLFAGGLQCALLEEARAYTIERAEFRSLPEREANLREWLHSHRDRLPDAIFCHRDVIAPPLMKVLAEMKVHVPEEMSILCGLCTPGQGLAEAGVSSAVIPFTQTGEAALNALVGRMNEGGKPVAGARLPLHFAGGATTTAAENAALGI